MIRKCYFIVIPRSVVVINQRSVFFGWMPHGVSKAPSSRLPCPPASPRRKSAIALRVISARTAIRRMRKHSGRQRQEIPGGALRPVHCSVGDGEGRWEDPDMIITQRAEAAPWLLFYASAHVLLYGPPHPSGDEESYCPRPFIRPLPFARRRRSDGLK